MLIENRTQFICENVSRNSLGELCFAGMELLPLAKKYGTPLYLYDEARIRERCRTYLTAVKEGFGGRGKVLYASKAASFKRLYEIMNEEGMGITSCCSKYTACVSILLFFLFFVSISFSALHSCSYMFG